MNRAREDGVGLPTSCPCFGEKPAPGRHVAVFDSCQLGIHLGTRGVGLGPGQLTIKEGRIRLVREVVQPRHVGQRKPLGKSSRRTVVRTRKKCSIMKRTAIQLGLGPGPL